MTRDERFFISELQARMFELQGTFDLGLHRLAMKDAMEQIRTDATTELTNYGREYWNDYCDSIILQYTCAKVHGLVGRKQSTTHRFNLTKARSKT